MVAVLLKDWIVRLSLFLWFGGVALYVLPGIPESWAVEFGGRYYHLPTVLPPMLASFVGLRRLPEPLERRFWLIIGSAFAAWFAVSLRRTASCCGAC
jgi:hypothetical protein